MASEAEAAEELPTIEETTGGQAENEEAEAAEDHGAAGVEAEQNGMHEAQHEGNVVPKDGEEEFASPGDHDMDVDDVTEPVASGTETAEAAAGTRSPSPTPSQVAYVFAPDDEQTRQERFAKLREVVSSLSDINAAMKKRIAQSPGGSPRGEPANSAAESSAAKLPLSPNAAGFVDLDDSDSEDDNDNDPDDFRSVVDDQDKESVIQELFEERNITGEEATRLLGLLVDQQDKLYKKLERLIEAQGPPVHVESLSSKLLNRLLGGHIDEACTLVDTLLPAVLMETRDRGGLTPLHHAARLMAPDLIWKILEKCPEMANEVTYDRTPPRCSVELSLRLSLSLSLSQSLSHC